MQTICWNQTHLNYEFHCVKATGGIQLGLHRLYRQRGSHERGKEAVTGTPVLMLADFMEDQSIFFPDMEHSKPDTRLGLAPMLASEGYDVFMLDLRGKGRSWPALSGEQNWGLHQAIMEDIPSHLTAVARLRPGCPQIWIGKGLGSVLLTCAYARIDVLPAQVLGIAHLGAGRQSLLANMGKAIRDQVWRLSQQLSGLLFGQVKGALLGPAQESRQLAKEWRNWRMNPEWRDPYDGFNFRLALKQKTLPSCLYMNVKSSSGAGDLMDCKHWLEELGEHDAIVMAISRASGNLHNYSGRELLTHKDAIDDHLLNLHHWLVHICRGSPESEKKLA